MESLQTYYSNDWEGNQYWWDETWKKWCIHDGKQKLYVVKCSKLIQYLESNKFPQKHTTEEQLLITKR